MPLITILIGLLLILLGKSFYFGLEADSFTALIPAFFGIPILICGLIAIKPSVRKHAMHAAMLFAALGVLMPLGMLPRRIANGDFSAATIEMLLLLILSAILLVAGIHSFIQARKNRKALEKASA